MDMVQLHRAARPAGPYSWTVPLSRPARPGIALRLDEMNASEQMFFFGAPLAHVVQYEEDLRATRQERAFRQLTRVRRTFNLAATEPLHPLPSTCMEVANEG